MNVVNFSDGVDGLAAGFNPARIFMGDSGSNLLGLLLACAAVLGLLKTTAIFVFALPLVLLAVPILDTGFVVARRIKNRLPFYRADAGHFHHRLAGFGFSPRRTVLVLYAWSATLAAFALALRFVPAREEGVIQPGWLALLALFGLVALAATVYSVYLLELFELDRLKRLQLRRRGDPVSDERVHADVERQLDTGELPARDPG
jgi:UDP-GlcNAc:undecaprenyl-phosphate GlcNAc-1-phosphate transferase